MIDTVVSILFPLHCLGCKKAGEAICNRCIQCSRKCLSTPASFIVSAFDYREPLIKRAIHDLKYKHKKILIPPLANELARILKKDVSNNSVLVPMPQVRMRCLLRGYNHATAIVYFLSRELNLPHDESLLLRSRHTKRQVTAASRKERLANQKGSFIASSSTKGKHIIVVDDVTTTGATAKEARSVLLQAGAASVIVVTLAH